MAAQNRPASVRQLPMGELSRQSTLNQFHAEPHISGVVRPTYYDTSPNSEVSEGWVKPEEEKELPNPKPQTIAATVHSAYSLLLKRNAKLWGRPVVPHVLKVALPYCDYHTLSSPATAGNVTVLNYNPISIYDPYVSGVGHQPLGHDEWALFYKEYYVERVSWKLTVSASNDTVTQVAFAIPTRSTTLTLTGLNSITEQPNSKHELVRHSNAGPTTVLKGIFRTGQWFPGVQLMTIDDLRAEFGASPVESLGLHFGIGSISTQTASSFYVTVDLVYHVVLLKPNMLQSS